MHFIDLFAGLGGFHLATAKSGGRCVFACELDAKLRQAYSSNFGIEPAADIREVQPSDVPSHDLLCAGFPCQPFSKAGGQRGRADKERGTVFDSIVDVLRVHRPSFVLLENVAHFVRHDKGKTYTRVRKKLEYLGYAVSSATLSPHQFGVPQIRQRMYLVGRLYGLNGFTWPEPTTRADELSLRDFLDERPADAKALSPQVVLCLKTWQEFLDAIPAGAKLPSFPIWSMESGASYPYDRGSLHEVPLKLLRRERGSFGVSLGKWFRKDLLQLVPSYARRRENAFPKWKMDFIRKNRQFLLTHRSALASWTKRIRRFPPSLQKLEWNCQGEERNIWEYVIQFRASGVRVKRATTSPSLVAMTTTQVPIIGWERRYMTVRECARLQCMEELKHLPRYGAAMAAFGNAVNVRVARLVLDALLSG